MSAEPAESIRLVEVQKSWEQPPRVLPLAAELEREITGRALAVAGQRARVFAEECVAQLQELVRIPSVNPSERFERDVGEYLADRLRKFGMELTQIEPQPHRLSNLGVLPGERGAPTLLIDAHMDTVPVGSLANWRFPPFDATIAEGRIWGRGSKDSKLGIASALMALTVLQRCDVRLRGTLKLAFTADEEMGGHLGLHQLVERGLIRADYAIYGEGMPDTITAGHNGWFQCEVTTRGKTSHSAKKAQGVNAVLKMCEVAPALDAMQFRGFTPHPIVPGQPIASVNIVRGGFKENVVPDTCTATVDIRFPPGYTPAQIQEGIRRTLEARRAASPLLQQGEPEEVRPVNVARPSCVLPGEPVVQYLRACVKDVLGVDPRHTGMLATSDTRWSTLDANLPMVGYSMGNDSGHQPNEYVVITEYLQNVKVYALLMLMLLT
ncbi:MAG: ArgE/DapE family deacylase [Deltaproteobacteria bacterium]|nr:ArgE/DapE family deacylase [Deltaproteobacteria bacterium]